MASRKKSQTRPSTRTSELWSAYYVSPKPGSSCKLLRNCPAFVASGEIDPVIEKPRLKRKIHVSSIPQLSPSLRRSSRKSLQLLGSDPKKNSERTSKDVLLKKEDSNELALRLHQIQGRLALLQEENLKLRTQNQVPLESLESNGGWRTVESLMSEFKEQLQKVLTAK